MKHLLLLLSILFFSGVYSQDEIQADILELNFLGDSDPKNLMIFQNQIYFTANDGLHGRELWKIENDLPVLVMDITEGSTDTFNENCIFLVTNDFIYFTTTNGKRLWKSDGTEIGTTLLLSNIESGYSCFSQMIEYNSKVYFSYDDGIHGFELWQTDGTVEGTTIIKDVYQGSIGSDIQDFFIFNNILFFTAINGTETGSREIWKSDGTELGTMMLKDIGGQSYFDGVKSGNDFLVIGNYFFFYGYTDSFGYELWKSDGTEQGTQMVKDIYPGYTSSEYSYNRLYGAVGDGFIVFRAITPDSGYELWRSDGTESGTFKVKEINTNNGIYGGSIPDPGWLNTSIYNYNGKVYFTATQGDTYDLWVTDGTEAGTVKFLDLDVDEDEYYGGFKEFNNKLYFFNNRRVVQTDGNSSHIFVNMQEDGGVSNFQPLNDKVYFTKNFDDINGLEIWESKINNQNLKVLEINSRHGSSPRNFASFGDKVVFFGQSHTYYEVPMISDGTQEGTKAILDEPSFRVDNNDAADFYKSGNNLFFKAYTGYYGNTELYKTDGTPEGTGLVKDLTGHGGQGLAKELYASYNNILYFVGNDNFHGNELYRSDGTEEGTYMVKNLSDGDYEGSPFGTHINSFTIKDDYLYFSGGLDAAQSYPYYEGTVGIWRTDGTEVGTEIVVQLDDSGFYDNGPRNMITIGNKIFFTKNDSNSSWGDHSLYVTEGTQETTFKIGDWAGDTSGGAYGVRHLVELNGKLYFESQNNDNHFKNLFVSDGTIEGTHPVNENLGFDGILKTVKCGNYIYFFTGYYSNINYGTIWKTDGTSEGTTQVSNFGVNTENCACFSDKLLYTENNSYSNIIYVSNGHDVFQLTVDFNYDFQTNNYEGIRSLFANQNKLYLTIITYKYGHELYVASPDFLLTTEEINEGLTKDNSNVLIYPNPTSSEINVVSNDQSQIKQIQLYDLTGKLMEIGIYNSEEVKLNLNKYNSGIYLLKVQTEKNTTTKKVILK